MEKMSDIDFAKEEELASDVEEVLNLDEAFGDGRCESRPV